MSYAQNICLAWSAMLLWALVDDDDVVDNVLNVHLVLLKYLVLGGLTPPEEQYVTLEEFMTPS